MDSQTEKRTVLNRQINARESNSPVVLIVDDDAACREEYALTLEELGYRCKSASDPKDALAQLGADPDIGIILTDIRMPGIDGIGLLHEVGARFRSRRPIVGIVVSAFANTDAIVSSMRAEAIDFLAKPLRRGDLAQALRRAMVAWENERQRSFNSQISGLNDRVDNILKFVRKNADPGNGSIDYSSRQYITTLQWLIDARRKRFKYLHGAPISDASWDILLDLMLSQLKGVPVAASSASLAAAIPLTTALRRVSEMVGDGYIVRRGDPSDKRRDIIEISEETFEGVKQYLNNIMSSLDVTLIEEKYKNKK